MHQIHNLACKKAILLKINLTYETGRREMIKITQIKVPIEHCEEDVKKKAAKLLKLPEDKLFEFEILKRSLDARKKPELFYSYTVRVKTDKEEKLVKKLKNKDILLDTSKEYKFPYFGQEILQNRPIIVGSGPAGLFCAFFLAKNGFSPVLLERGKEIYARQKDVDDFWNGKGLNPESNVQFGEGGAGTFSDGKLNTLNKDKDGKNREVLKTFVEFGAKPEILYEQKPHVGTDILKTVVIGMRNEIIRLGGSVRFEAKLTNLKIEDNRLTGIEINNQEWLDASQLVLAIGHSARDTFSMLYENKLKMEAKDFAVGFRVEHNQRNINVSQYGEKYADKLPPASYKLTATSSSGRGIYSFCMCPGGYVVNASSEEGRCVVNGMSYSDRGSQNANSAIIVSVNGKDFSKEHPLGGIEFQRQLEERAYRIGKGKVPVQFYGDFKEAVTGRKANLAPKERQKNDTACIKGLYSFGDLSQILSEELNLAWIEGMEKFEKSIPGFADDKVFLAGVESRTSSPVRILRDEILQSNIRGIYPCGEGAGYAGGITSAAMDGILVAEAIAEVLANDMKK